MKLLNDHQIKFIRHTRVTPTVIQCDEWNRTIWPKAPCSDEIFAVCYALGIAQNKPEALKFWDELLYVFNLEDDGLALEDTAIYLFRTFLTRKEMEDMLAAPAIHSGYYGYRLTESGQWLQDWKYFFGYRKTPDANEMLEKALDPRYELHTDMEGDVYYVNTSIDNME